MPPRSTADGRNQTAPASCLPPCCLIARVACRRQHRIKPLRCPPKDPAPLLVAGERKRISCLCQNLRERAFGCGKVRAEREPRGAERGQQLAEKTLRCCLAPTRGCEVQRRDLEEHVGIVGKAKQAGIGRKRWPVDQMRARAVI